MSYGPNDIRSSPKSGIVVLTLFIAVMLGFMYLMARTGGLQHPIGVILFIGQIFWIALCAYGIKDAIDGLRGKKRRPRAHNRVVHQSLSLRDYGGTGPIVIHPQSHGYVGVTLPGIITLLLLPLFILNLVCVIFANSEDLSAFLISALIIGVVLFIAGLRMVQQYLKLRFVNRVRISVSAPPTPGSTFNVDVSHPELHRIKRMAVDLIMEESIIDTSEENAIYEKQYVATVPICRLSRKRADRGGLTSRTCIELPAGTIPSFKSTHFQVNWFFLVRLDLELWEGLEQRFPLTVLPADYANRNFDVPQNQTA